MLGRVDSACEGGAKGHHGDSFQTISEYPWEKALSPEPSLSFTPENLV